MSRIRDKNTNPEQFLKEILRALKIPFKSNYKNLPGKPDVYIAPLDLVIEVRGCFWHGHKNCKYFVTPKTNTDFWLTKINGNISRDKNIILKLKKSGIKTCIIWECEIKDATFFDKLLDCINRQAKITTPPL